MPKIFGIMIIYNKKLSDSPSFLRLSDNNIKTVVCDNSTSSELCVKDNINEVFCREHNMSYIKMDGNKGLSVGYNMTLSYIKNNYDIDDDDYVCIFDDDTELDSSYFEVVSKSTEDILLPVVYDGIGIMSPVLMKRNVAKRFKTKEELLKSKPNELSGINSAMAIKYKILKNYRYNEEMFLDYIDHMFIMDMRGKSIFPKVIDVNIHQNFSAVTDSKEESARRFRLQKNDLKVFYNNDLLAYYYIVAKKHIKLAIKYRDIRMIMC